MRRAGAIAGILASLVTIGLSAAINARFGYSLSTNPIDSEILAAASIAFDVLKAIGLFFIVTSWRNSQWMRVGLASLLWLVVLVYSMASAIGFAALNRSDMSTGRSGAAAHYGDIRSSLERINSELAAISTLRSSDAVAADIGGMMARSEWNYSAGCQQPSRPPSWCQSYFRLKDERAEAEHREALTAQRDKLVAESAQLPAISESDPQTAVLSTIIPIATGLIRTGLVALVAIAMEVVSSTGLYVSASAWNDPEKDPRKTQNEMFAGLIAKVDGLSAKIDSIERIDESQAGQEEFGADEVIHVSLTNKGREQLGMPPRGIAPKLVTQNGQLVDSAKDAPRKTKNLIENRDPNAKPQFADPRLIAKVKEMGGGYEGSLEKLSGVLGIAISTLHKKLVQAQAAGRIAWQSKPGVGTSIKLIEGTDEHG